MKRYSAALAALALASILGQPADAKHGDVAAALIGGVVGAAIGAALTKDQTHDTVIYTNRPSKPHRDGAFFPAPDVECFDRRQACYHLGGGYSARWTHSIYGY